MVGDQQRTARVRDVLDPLDLDSEPVVVEEVVDGAVDKRFDALGAPPVRQLALGLEPGEVITEVLPARGEGRGALERGCGEGAGGAASSTRMPGHPAGPALRITTTSPALSARAVTAAIASSSDSNARAGPEWRRRSWPASLTTQPSGARLPRRIARPPVGLIG